MPQVCLLGIGNVLMGDDALGPQVIKLLEARYRFPEAVSVYDAGTPGLDLTAYMAGHEALVIVDVVKAKGAPGELRLYDKAALIDKPPILALSPHEPGLREALLAAEFQGAAPREALLVGVIPERVDTGVGLTAPVRGAIPAVIDAVLAALARLGVPAEPRNPPLDPDIWWERPPDPRAGDAKR